MKKIERGTGSRCKIEKVGYWRAGKKFDQRDAFGKEQKKKKKKKTLACAFSRSSGLRSSKEKVRIIKDI